eukprot:6188875-Pleurochrysis_carterae.AAC.1
MAGSSSLGSQGWLRRPPSIVGGQSDELEPPGEVRRDSNARAYLDDLSETSSPTRSREKLRELERLPNAIGTLSLALIRSNKNLHESHRLVQSLQVWPSHMNSLRKSYGRTSRERSRRRRICELLCCSRHPFKSRSTVVL